MPAHVDDATIDRLAEALWETYGEERVADWEDLSWATKSMWRSNARVAIVPVVAQLLDQRAHGPRRADLVDQVARCRDLVTVWRTLAAQTEPITPQMAISANAVATCADQLDRALNPLTPPTAAP